MIRQKKIRIKNPKTLFITWTLLFSLAIGVSPIKSEQIFYDALNRKVVLPDRPKRIISFAPSITEILYFLGVEDRIVGVTEYSYYPPEAQKKPKIGSYININMEKVLSLKPDLVIATKDGNPPHVVEMLEQSKIPVYVINPRTLEEIVHTIFELAKVVEVSKDIQKEITNLKERIEVVRKKAKEMSPIKVFLQINIKPIITVGRDTLHNDIISTAGGKNIFGDSGTAYPRVSVEEVIKRAPEVILISSMERDGPFEEAKKEWLRWDTIPAVRNNRIYVVDSDLIDRPTPRAVSGLEYIFDLLSGLN